MIRLVISILLFIILAVFVALNAQNTTTIDIFGYEFEEVSVAAVVTITLAVGVLYSFILYVINYLSKARAERLKNQKRKNKVRASELAEKEKVIKQSPPSANEPTEATEKIEYAMNDVPSTKSKRTKKRRSVEQVVAEESAPVQATMEGAPVESLASHDSRRKWSFKLSRKSRTEDEDRG